MDSSEYLTLVICYLSVEQVWAHFILFVKCQDFANAVASAMGFIQSDNKTILPSVKITSAHKYNP